MSRSVATKCAGVNYPKLTLFGASIIQYSYGQGGISARLAELYQRKLDITTKGFEGYNSRWALPLARPIFEMVGPKHEAIIIFIGTNDSAVLQAPIALPESEFVANMSRITETALEYTDTVVLVGPTLVNELADNDSARARSNKRAYEFSQGLKGIAEKYKAEFIDLWSVFRTSNGEAGIMPGKGLLAGERGYTGPKRVDHLVHDGVHFTAEASDLFYRAVLEALEKRGKGPGSYVEPIPGWLDVLKASM